MSKAEERSKEIIQAALDYANNLDDVKPTDEFRRNLCIALGQAFMKGAEWADSHQAEKDLIDKAIGWIGEIYNHHHIMRYSDSCEPPLSELTEWFKNYMKEQNINSK